MNITPLYYFISIQDVQFIQKTIMLINTQDKDTKEDNSCYLLWEALYSGADKLKIQS